ncbi:MAG: hypothetical protein ACPGLV_12880 [Bacteroidia bacterium]
MVASRKVRLEILGVATRCIDVLLEKGLFSNTSAEYFIYEKWLKNYKMPKHQSLSFYIHFWVGDNLSQNFNIHLEHKSIVITAADNLWFEEEGQRMAEDGTWIWASTKTEIKVYCTLNGTIKEFEKQLKRHLQNFKDSNKIKIGIYLDDFEKMENDFNSDIDDSDIPF